MEDLQTRWKAALETMHQASEDGDDLLWIAAFAEAERCREACEVCRAAQEPE